MRAMFFLVPALLAALGCRANHQLIELPQPGTLDGFHTVELLPISTDGPWPNDEYMAAVREASTEIPDLTVEYVATDEALTTVARGKAATTGRDRVLYVRGGFEEFNAGNRAARVFGVGGQAKVVVAVELVSGVDGSVLASGRAWGVYSGSSSSFGFGGFHVRGSGTYKETFPIVAAAIAALIAEARAVSAAPDQ